jgi:hypothetical protein
MDSRCLHFEIEARQHGGSIATAGFCFLVVLMKPWPNKSPEPTAVGHRSSAVAAHVVSRRWLSFLR